MNSGAWFWAGLLAGVAALVVAAVVFLPPPEPLRQADAPPVESVPPVAGPSLPFPESAAQMAPVAAKGRGAAGPGMTEGGWEDRLDNILSSDLDEAATARQLLAALAGLPLEAREEYIVHALNLCPDEEFAMMETVFLDPQTPAAVAETIFDDVLNRTDELKLPLLARSLANPRHPMHGEAREILELYLDIESGRTPPAGWQAAVQEYLRSEAAELAEPVPR